MAKKNVEQNNKQELANRIADRSQKVAVTYTHFSEVLGRIGRWFSDVIDNVVFNGKYIHLVSLGIAILCYVAVNYTNNQNMFNTLQSSKDIDNVQVIAKYNSDTFELSGLPETANVTISGEGPSVNNAAAQGGSVIANLEGLTEGTHTVKLSGDGFKGNVRVKVEPSNVTVTLKKKTTRQFDLGYDFINLDKMDSIYSVTTPEFEFSKVNVRASKDTLDSIAFVKALIDVSSVTADFEQETNLIAYDKYGMPVNADIVPKTVKVNVKVTSPNKTVPVSVELTGEISGDMAIESITLDQQSVTIYAPDSVLNKIENVVVTLDVSTITSDSTIMRPITLPSGVNSSNINQITMDVKLGEKVTKTFDNIPIYYRNNTNNYKFTPENGKTTTSVEVSGTQSAIDAITENDIKVYFDMANCKPGITDFPLMVESIPGSYVKLTVNEPTYKVNVLGETNDDEEETTDNG